MLREGLPRPTEHTGEFGPEIGCAHVDNPHRVDSWPGRLAALDAPPTLLFRCQLCIVNAGFCRGA
jgi:hypothetical protein